MGTKIDGADWHIGGAGTWERATRPIGLFVLLAARHGLTSAEVDVAELERDPVDYVMREWDSTLDSSMLIESATPFLATEYREQYLPAYTDAVLQLGGASGYAEVDEAELRVQLEQVVGSLAGGFRLLDSLFNKP